MTPEDVVNNALEAVGHHVRIASFYDGSPEAIAARDMWGITRDAMLIKVQPDWARRLVPLILVKSAPVYGYDDMTPWTSAYPDLPWLYEFLAPPEVLVPLALQARMHTLPVWRPKPLRFRLKPDETGFSYAILANDPSPVLACIVQVVDTDMWHEDFTPIVIDAMAQRLLPLFGSQTMKQAAQREQRDANSG